MKFACISDIHGNFEALKFVLNDIEKSEDIDLILCNGDIVGYYPHPLECIELVRNRCEHVIQGNHDEVVVSNDFNKEIAWFNPIAAESLVWTRNQLLLPDSHDDMLFIKRLKIKKELEISGKRILLIHGTVEQKWEYFLKDQYTGQYNAEQKKRMRGWLDKWDIVLLGHTHQPFIFNHQNRIVLNPGSVGQPRDGIPEASYAIIEIKKALIQAEIIRVKYDIEKTCEALNKEKLSNVLCQRLFLGR